MYDDLIDCIWSNRAPVSNGDTGVAAVDMAYTASQEAA